MKLYLLTLLLCISFFACKQGKEIRIGYIEANTNGEAKNPSINIADYNVIIDRFLPPNGKNTVYIISWPDTLTEGNFYLEILTNMIFIRQGHNNPNPNTIYWTYPINFKQYEGIKLYLESGESNNLVKQHKINSINVQYINFKSNSTIKDINTFQKFRIPTLVKDINFILSDLNSFLDQKIKIPMLEIEDLKYCLILRDEIELKYYDSYIR